MKKIIKSKIKKIMGAIGIILLFILAGFFSYVYFGQSPQDDFPGRRISDRMGMNRSRLLDENRSGFMGREAPPEMLETCDGKSEGDECEFEGRMGEMEGTCKLQDRGLMCLPDRPPSDFLVKG